MLSGLCGYRSLLIVRFLLIAESLLIVSSLMIVDWWMCGGESQGDGRIVLECGGVVEEGTDRGYVGGVVVVS